MPERWWRPEMARWLLTLNPGRTQDEYAKAARYFFQTSGVPQDLLAVTPDLLLAYRGALALRAERTGVRGARRARPAVAARLARLWAGAETRSEIEGEAPPRSEAPPTPMRPLAPATVNLRLTALRQFLRFASLRDPLPAITPDQIHSSLKRLPIERRRPYQILGEDEWAEFLAVARSPLPGAPPVPPPAPPLKDSASTTAARSVWGHTRAQRQRTAAEPGGDDARATVGTGSPARASDGRTGALTAQRDYALVALALATGLRAIELSLLDVGDITSERRQGREEWWLTLPDEKTKGQRGGRALPLAAELMAALREYIHATGRSLSTSEDRATPLFLALQRGPGGDHQDSHVARLRPEQIRGVINRVETQWLARREAATVDGQAGSESRRISPHALRHSAAIALLKGSEEAGRPPASVEHVRGWLGHFDIRTTQRYLDHLASREERRRFVIAPLNASPSFEDGESSGKPDIAGPHAGEEGDL